MGDQLINTQWMTELITWEYSVLHKCEFPSPHETAEPEDAQDQMYKSNKWLSFICSKAAPH